MYRSDSQGLIDVHIRDLAGRVEVVAVGAAAVDVAAESVLLKSKTAGGARGFLASCRLNFCTGKNGRRPEKAYLACNESCCHFVRFRWLLSIVGWVLKLF